MIIDFKKITFSRAMRVLILFGCLIFIADSLPLLFLGTTSAEKSPIFVFAFSMVAMYILVKRILVSQPRQFYRKAMIGNTIQQLINQSIGPAPWYWNTFPIIVGSLKNKFVWNFLGEKGKHAYLVSLSSQNNPQQVKIVLNTYARAFFIPPHYLGVWYCPDNQIYLHCFDPEKMPSFTLDEIPSEFKNSKSPYYTLANPKAEAIVPATLQAGSHNVLFPEEFASLEELLLLGPYVDPAVAVYAIFELQPKTGDVKVLPQKWFTTTKFDISYQWITRVARDPQSGTLYGDGIRIGIFELSDDGCHLSRWIGRS